MSSACSVQAFDCGYQYGAEHDNCKLTVRICGRARAVENFTITLNTLIKDTIKKHKRIIFNGNNYSEEWVAEAERRGLLNLRTTVDAICHLINEKNINLFKKHGVLSESELRSRHEIFLENYSKTVIIEALTMADMIKRDVLPCVLEYNGRLAEIANQKKALCPGISVQIETNFVNKITELRVHVSEA